jgi:hypothetical protein
MLKYDSLMLLPNILSICTICCNKSAIIMNPRFWIGKIGPEALNKKVSLLIPLINLSLSFYFSMSKTVQQAATLGISYTIDTYSS